MKGEEILKRHTDSLLKIAPKSLRMLMTSEKEIKKPTYFTVYGVSIRISGG